jgi:DNA (cytosine-5)-methyltransferase 1
MTVTRGRPLLLDLFCGAGGAAAGYHRAGFDVVGVDIEPQPRYPFEFHQADALEVLRVISLRADSRQFAAIHASPVCKLWSAATPAWARANHRDLLTPTRQGLMAAGLPWVIENVPRAPLRPDFKICGCMVGLHEIERERWFETSGWHQFELRQSCFHADSPVTVAGHGEPSGTRRIKAREHVISVVGGGADKSKPHRMATVADWRRVMGIDWMTRDELAQAIPPAYTEHIGRQLLEHLAVWTSG